MSQQQQQQVVSLLLPASYSHKTNKNKYYCWVGCQGNRIQRCTLTRQITAVRPVPVLRVCRCGESCGEQDGRWKEVRVVHLEYSLLVWYNLNYGSALLLKLIVLRWQLLLFLLSPVYVEACYCCLSYIHLQYPLPLVREREGERDREREGERERETVLSTQVTPLKILLTVF